MGYKLNVFTGTLDLVGGTGAGSGDVVGPSSSTDKGIARYNGTTGKLIQDSSAVIQDGGAILAQGFISKNTVTDLVSVGSDETWIAPDLTLDLSGDIVVALGGTILIEE